ncbi:MAG TPA: serine/threonine-protein kinase [Phycisphaerales bacterium]|nr:serine/threonine-protein kinase [Phycisphaerales bacterium]
MPQTAHYLDDLSRFTRLDASRRTLPGHLADHAAARWEAGLEAPIEWYHQAFLTAGARLPDDAFPPIVMAELARLHPSRVPARLETLRRAFPGRAREVDELATIAAALSDADAAVVRSLNPGDRFGKYTLHRRLGEGAFGQVWLARDDELHRDIALKVLHSQDPDSDAALLTEARAAAALDHPTIAKVHAVGTAEFDDGSPPRAFIDMQLVADPPPGGLTGDGVPPSCIAAPLQSLTRPLPPREAAAVSATIARALAAAHARGIVHGDVKPANALRTPSGRVMVVDFGLSRRTTDARLRAGRITGTPAYLAPEQADGAAPTPLSDVYAAGATLRFLLTGRPLYEPTRGSDEPHMDIIAQVKAVPPADWTSPVPRSLRRIADKATARNVADRYTSADQLAADLEAWLSNAPVFADPPSTSRRLALWYRRNIIPATIAAAAIIALTAVTVRFVALVQRERDEALAARADADTKAIQSRAAADLAQKKTREAENAAATAEATSQFMERMLVAAMPHSGGRDVKVIDAVNRAVDFIPKWVGDQPEVEANVRSAIGKVYLTLGDWARSQPQLDRAVELRRKAFGAEHPLTIKAEHLRAQLSSFRGEATDTEPGLRALLDRARASRGEDDEVTIAIQALLCRSLRYTRPDQALTLARDVLDRRTRVLGPAHQDTVDGRAELARALGVQGALGDRRSLDEAVGLMEEVLRWREREHGHDHHFTLVTRSDLAALYMKRGEVDRAEPLLRGVMQTRMETLGPTHPNTLAPAQMLASLLAEQRGDPQAAAELLEPCVVALLAADRSQSSNGVIACRLYADYLQRTGRPEQAVDVARRTLPAAKRLLRPGHDELKRLDALSAGSSPEP